MTSAEGIKRLVEEARKNAQFFHDLVFDPEKVILSLDYLDRRTKGALLQLNPSKLFQNIIPTVAAECGDTCGGSSCSSTCGSGSCIGTCGSSCGGTCASSCDKTSSFGLVMQGDPGPDVVAVVGAVGVAGRAAGARKARR